jgi:spermidine synthase
MSLTRDSNPNASGASRLAVLLLVLCSGFAALSWEVIWQLQASLALGVSALGTAITLAATMGGMTVGSIVTARWLERQPLSSPLLVYGLCELAIGLSGLVMQSGFSLLESLDAAVYGSFPAATAATHLIGIVLLLGVPTFAMGATIPILGLVSRRYGLSLASVYATNTAGAAFGCLLIAFALIPSLGVYLSIQILAVINIGVCLAAFFMQRGHSHEIEKSSHTSEVEAQPLARYELWVAGITGFATFGLEVAWFRSLRAAFQSTTDTFAIVLASVLIALAAGARLAAWLQRRDISMVGFLTAAGVAIIAVTPLVERFDLIGLANGYWAIMFRWLGACLIVLGPPVLLLGVSLPWLLDRAVTPRAWGRMYAINTIGAVLGSLVAAWLLLPMLGFARTSWALGILVLGTGIAGLQMKGRIACAALGALALILGNVYESGIGRDRIQALGLSAGDYRLIEFSEGPDATASVVETKDGFRGLYIDGFRAASGFTMSSYMTWMGHLPAMLHPNPKQGLVICFGTGQTANALRSENLEHVDVVDLSPAVIEMAHHFTHLNKGVLEDPRVKPIVMDGRAWLRRTETMYDVLTLEPMPPNFAGVNALYSEEFYRLAEQRLNDGGVIAQWMPYHILTPGHSLAVAATFAKVFPDSVLWVDPTGKTGIILGRKGTNTGDFGRTWPGFDRKGPERLLDNQAVAQALRLDTSTLAHYIRHGVVITDDNQLLAYGLARKEQALLGARMYRINLDIVESARNGEL